MLLQLASKVRLVVANERAQRLCERPPSSIHWIRSAPHHVLFRRVAAVVHHGGAGTTHTAARAGVPQIVVPHLADQYYWAYRVHHLGLAAAPLDRNALSSRALERAIDDSSVGTTIAVTSARVGEVLRDLAERALDDATDYIIRSARRQAHQ